MVFTRVTVALVLLGLVAVPYVEAQTSDETSSGPVLRPGDAVRIMIWRKPEISGEFQIAADGSIADPFYMDVRLAGLPLDVASARVRTHVAQYETDPRVLLEPLFRVAVGGEVRNPNLYSLREETTIAEAVMLAGGLTERGRSDRVWLYRDGQELVVDLTGPSSDLAHSFIQSGDRILVSRQRSLLRDYVGPVSSVIGAVGALVVAFRARW